MSKNEDCQPENTAETSASALNNLVIRDITTIRRITLEWPSSNKNGYDEATNLVRSKYGDYCGSTVRLGPKAIDVGRCDPHIHQWVLDVYV